MKTPGSLQNMVVLRNNLNKFYYIIKIKLDSLVLPNSILEFISKTRIRYDM